MMKQGAPLMEGPIWRAIWRLSLPIILANVLQTGYAITDTYWVGQLSAEAVAAVSLSFPINFLLIAMAGGLPIAGTVLIAQYRGRGDSTAMNHVAAQTMLMVFLVSVVLTAGGYFLSEPIMRFMGAAPNVLPDATRFTQVTFLGFLFVFAFFAFQSLMRGLGVVYMPMFIVALTVLLNFVLDPLFIFGWGIVPAMGVSGAAMATLSTQALATAIGVIVLYRGRYGLRVRLRDYAPDLAFMRRAFRLGLPASLEQVTYALSMTVMTQLVADFGTFAVAAYGVGTRILICVLIPAMGLSMATSTMVGQSIGAGRMDRAERVNLVGCVMAFAILMTAGALLFPVARPLSAFFVPHSAEAIAESTAFIRVTAFTFGLIGILQVLTGTLRGAGDTIAPMLLAVVSQFVLRFPLAYLLSRHTGLGLEGVWWSFCVSNILAAVIALLWYLRGDWKRKKLLEDVELERKVREETVIEEGSHF
jgi:putative MATE family efflux protein